MQESSKKLCKKHWRCCDRFISAKNNLRDLAIQSKIAACNHVTFSASKAFPGGCTLGEDRIIMRGKQKGAAIISLTATP
jgi:hypothetical protein